MSNFLEDEQEIKTELISTEKHYMNGTIEFIDHTKDKVAAAVDQTLVGAVEEKLADKQSQIDDLNIKLVDANYAILGFKAQNYELQSSKTKFEETIIDSNNIV